MTVKGLIAKSAHKSFDLFPASEARFDLSLAGGTRPAAYSVDDFYLVTFLQYSCVVLRPGNHLMVESHSKMRRCDIQFLDQVTERIGRMYLLFLSINS
jgi:hypothetical protein